MARKILMVVTSRGDLGEAGGKTGTWLEEMAAPYYAFLEAGLEIEIASPRGGAAPLDPGSLEAPWVSPAGERFLADETAGRQMRNTRMLGDVDVRSLDALFLVGGAGAAWDFPADHLLASLIEDLDRRGAVLAGVCHGVLGLTGAIGGSGTSLVHGRRVTAISNVEEGLVGLQDVVPMLPERRLTELGAVYTRAEEPFGAHVVVDGNLHTGQNPASAAPLARSVVEALQAAHATA